MCKRKNLWILGLRERTWFDARVKHIILSTLTMYTCTKILSCKSAKDIWIEMEEMYGKK